MKRIRLFICVSAVMFSFCGCSNPVTHETESTNLSINESINDPVGGETNTDDNVTDETIGNETQSGLESDDKDLFPDDVKDGDILQDGSIYFENVMVDSAEDIKNILDQYGDGKKDITFTTPEYSGMLSRTEDSYLVYKSSDTFDESVNYMDIGIVNTIRNEYDNGVLVFNRVISTEADYYVDTHYKDNILRTEYIGNDETIRLVKDYETGSDYHVLTYVKYDGGEQWFEYTDKANKVLSSMSVYESNGAKYTFTLDGVGNDVENIVSMTLTKGGSTATYAKNEIPWQNGYVSPPGRLTAN